jgi:exosome complex RNA-binding protein Rrp42 (RNase PH superfamily)
LVYFAVECINNSLVVIVFIDRHVLTTHGYVKDIKFNSSNMCLLFAELSVVELNTSFQQLDVDGTREMLSIMGRA